MNFKPALAEMVMRGEKTVTRRLTSQNPRSPWFVDQCALKVDRTYAVCPGRGKNAIGRVRIVSVRREPLGVLNDAEARLEGCADAIHFTFVWRAINGAYDPHVLVWRVEFEVVPADDAARLRAGVQWARGMCTDGAPAEEIDAYLGEVLNGV